MSDTIDLLEAIGRDASLRYASQEALGDLLEQAQASESLVAAARAGDREPLARDFGHVVMQSPHTGQSIPGHEGEPDDDDDEPVPPVSPDRND